MTHTCVIKALSVVVNSHRTIGDLVTTITVDISNSEVVISLSSIGAMGLAVFTSARGIGVEYPMLFQFTTVPIPCGKDCTCVITSTENGRGVLAIEITHSSEHAIRTVGVIVAPVLQVPTLRNIGFGIHSLACDTIEHGDIFSSCEDSSGLGSSLFVILGPFTFRCRVLGIFGGTMTVVCQTVANDLSQSVARSV